MTTTQPPHLLTLPREIRDQIYGYLHREIGVGIIGTTDLTFAQVKLANAPIVPVLLAHSRLHDEYREADCFKKLTAIASCPLHMRGAHFAPLKQYKLDALSRVSRIHLHTEYFHHMYILFVRVRQLMRKLKSCLPHLQSFLLSVSTLPERLTTDQLCLDQAQYSRTALQSLPVPPSRQVGMNMVRRAGFFRYAWDDMRLRHELYQCGVYLYTNTPPESKWKLEDAAHRIITRSTQRYPEKLLSFLEQKRKGVSAILSAEVLGWRDQSRPSSLENQRPSK